MALNTFSSRAEEEYAFAKQTYEEQYEALNRLLDEAVERAT